MQLDHVALQVLLLHELLGAGGALQDRSRSPLKPPTPLEAGSPQGYWGGIGGRAQPEMLGGSSTKCDGHTQAEAEVVLQ